MKTRTSPPAGSMRVRQLAIPSLPSCRQKTIRSGGSTTSWVHKRESARRGKIQTALNDACPSSKRDKEKADFCIVYTAGDLGSLTCETNGGYALITDVKSRLAFTRPRCLAAYLEFSSVDFGQLKWILSSAGLTWGGNIHGLLKQNNPQPVRARDETNDGCM